MVSTDTLLTKLLLSTIINDEINIKKRELNQSQISFESKANNIFFYNEALLGLYEHGTLVMLNSTRTIKIEIPSNYSPVCFCNLYHFFSSCFPRPSLEITERTRKKNNKKMETLLIYFFDREVNFSGVL